MKDIIDQYSPILEGVEMKDMTNKIKKDVAQSRLPKIKKVKDKILKIKLHEAVNCIGKFCLTEGKVTEDKSIVQLLRYYELDKELNKI